MIEIALKNFTPLFEKLFQKYNVNLLNYASASLVRRVERFLNLHPFTTIDELSNRLLDDSAFFNLFIKEITVNTTEMFRDPDTWSIIRKQIIPLIKENPGIRIWHAGCSSGEEVYSMAILLKEEGVLDRSKIIASDINAEVIQTAVKGLYSVKSLTIAEENYLKAGGKNSFSDYYVLKEHSVEMKPELIANVRFLKHDLSTGNNFSKFDIILCRNVLIYFNKDLQERAFGLFHQSLFKRGFIIIGKKESMAYYSDVSKFNEFNAVEKIYNLK